jgi:hypothetical protein
MRAAVLLSIGLAVALYPRLAAEAQTPSWQAVRDVRVAFDDGPGVLTTVSGLTVGRDGRVYVSQPQEGIVRVYDSRGRFLRKIGRSGEGPGEFERPSRLGWRGDTLWVGDSPQARISLFRPDGSFVRSITFTRAGPLTGGRPNIPGSLLADGTVLGLWLSPMYTLAGPTPVVEPLVRFSARGDPLGVLGRRQRRQEFARVRSGTSSTYFAQPFSDSPLTAVAPDGSGLVIVTRAAATSRGQASFSVRKVHFSGRTAFERAYTYTPRPLTGDAVESVVNKHAGGMQEAKFRTPPEAAARRLIREALYRPGYLAPVTDVVIGRDGTIWLRRESTGRAVFDWQVLDAAGRPIGRVSLPAKVAVQYADRSQVWGVELDELDVPTLVRFRVVPGR